MHMKILLTTDWFLPGTNSGGPVRSIANLVAHLPELEFWIITRNTDYLSTTPYEDVPANQWYAYAPCVQVYYFSSDQLTAAKLEEVIAATKIQTLYVNGIYSHYFSILPVKIGKKWGLKTIVAPRGMLSPQAMGVKSLKKKLFVLVMRAIGRYKNTIFHLTSPQEVEDVQTLLKSTPTCIEIPNLPRLHEEEPIRKTKASGELQLVCIGRISPEKGTLDGLLQLLPFAHRNIQLDLYGAIYDTAYWEKCQAVIQQLTSACTVQYKGVVASDAIPTLLQGYHFLYAPTTGENYGHALVESLMNYRPVIVTPFTPWKNLEEHQAGYDGALSDFGKFIEQALEMSDTTYQAHCTGAQRYITQEIRLADYREAYLQLFQNR